MTKKDFADRKITLSNALLAGGLILVLLITTPAFAKTEQTPVTGFNLPTTTGTVSLDSLHAKVVLVDFWASWCAPCRQSFPWLKSLYDRYSTKGLAIVAINLDKKRELADDFLEDFDKPFIIAFDPSGKTAEAYNVQVMPSSYLVGPDGKILYIHPGFDLKKTGEIEDMIKEACSK